MIVLLVLINLVIVGFVVTGARDHDLTIKRLDTLQAFYAAEAGIGMSVKELMEDVDHDVDGVIGTISDDSDPITDPDIGNGKVFVFATADTPQVGQTTLTSRGSAGDARRDMQGVIE